MIVVIDTNVLLSAAFRDRLPERVVLFVSGKEDCRWLVTPSILAEYVSVLKRPKFGLSAELIDRWSELISSRAVVVDDVALHSDAVRDPKDAPFLAVALAQSADFLITGDDDLLHLSLAGTTQIVTPSKFGELMGIA